MLACGGRSTQIATSFVNSSTLGECPSYLLGNLAAIVSLVARSLSPKTYPNPPSFTSKISYLSRTRAPTTGADPRRKSAPALRSCRRVGTLSILVLLVGWNNFLFSARNQNLDGKLAVADPHLVASLQHHFTFFGRLQDHLPLAGSYPCRVSFAQVPVIEFSGVLEDQTMVP